MRDKRKADEPLALEYGRTAPQAKEIEEAVIGAILIDKNAFLEVSRILSPGSFYVEVHQKIFYACGSLAQRYLPIDILTVVEELNRTGDLVAMGGAVTVVALTKKVSSSANSLYHARIIQEKFIQREVIRIATEMIGKVYDEEPIDELLDFATSSLYKASKGLYKKDFTTPVTNATEARVELDNKMSREPGTLTGSPAGFESLDKVTYGWQKTDLIILAARPAVGKTAFALNLARNLGDHPKSKKGVAFFSLEMSRGQLVNRIISAISEIPLEKIRNGDLNVIEYQHVIAAIEKFSKIPIYIDDTTALTTMEFRSKLRRLVEEFGVGLGIIDYLQLMTPVDHNKVKNKNEQIGDISRDLKTIAKDLDIPIIALSQLSRSVALRGENAVPHLSDLRDSGAIEQDADLVMFLYLEGGVPKVRIAKHRNGTLATIIFSKDLSIQKFYNVSGEGYKPPPQLLNKSSSFEEGLPDADDEFKFTNKK